MARTVEIDNLIKKVIINSDSDYSNFFKDNIISYTDKILNLSTNMLQHTTAMQCKDNNNCIINNSTIQPDQPEQKNIYDDMKIYLKNIYKLFANHNYTDYMFSNFNKSIESIYGNCQHTNVLYINKSFYESTLKQEFSEDSLNKNSNTEISIKTLFWTNRLEKLTEAVLIKQMQSVFSISPDINTKNLNSIKTKSTSLYSEFLIKSKGSDLKYSDKQIFELLSNKINCNQTDDVKDIKDRQINALSAIIDIIKKYKLNMNYNNFKSILDLLFLCQLKDKLYIIKESSLKDLIYTKYMNNIDDCNLRIYRQPKEKQLNFEKNITRLMFVLKDNYMPYVIHMSNKELKEFLENTNISLKYANKDSNISNLMNSYQTYNSKIPENKLSILNEKYNNIKNNKYKENDQTTKFLNYIPVILSNDEDISKENVTFDIYAKSKKNKNNKII